MKTYQKNVAKRLLIVLVFIMLTISQSWAFDLNGISYSILNNTEVEVSGGDIKEIISIPESVTYNGITYKVTSIGARAFMGRYNNSNFTRKYVIPKTVREIKESAFYDNYYLEEVEFSEGLKIIGYDAFGFNYALKEIRIPSTVTSIGDRAFRTNRTNLAEIYCYASAPPSIGGDETFQGRTNTVLHVYFSTLNLYKNADRWKEFSSIEGVSKMNLAEAVDALNAEITSAENLLGNDSITESREQLILAINAAKALLESTDTEEVLAGIDELKAARDAFVAELYVGEKVYATFENPTNTNTTWNAETRTFTWNTTYYNNLKNIGLPNGDLSSYKKLVVDCNIKSGEQFRVIFFKGTSNETLWVSNGVNEFVLSDTLYDYKELIHSCDEIYIAGSGGIAPGEVVINSIYLETYSDYELQMIREDLSEMMAQASELLEKHMYRNIRTELTQAIATYSQPENQNSRECLDVIRSLTAQAKYSIKQYEPLESQINALKEKLESGCEEADSVLVEEATNYLNEIQGKFDEESFEENELWSVVSTLSNYLSALDKIVLTVHVETPGTLGSLINDQLSRLGGLIISGSLNKDDFNFLGWISLRSLNLYDTDITEISNGINTNIQQIVLPKNLTSIGNNSFTGCSQLKGIIFPVTLRYIGEYAFFDCSSLKQIVLPEGVTQMDPYSFCNCTSLETIDLPSTMSYVGKGAFSGDVNLRQVICKADNPPSTTGSLKPNNNCELIVRSYSVDKYKSRSYWKEFNNIIGIDITVEEWQGLIAQANELLAKPMGNGYRFTLTKDIEMYSQPEGRNQQNSFNDFINHINWARSSVEQYEQLDSLMSVLQRKLDQGLPSDSTMRELMKTRLSEILVKYSEESASSNEILTIQDYLNEIELVYLTISVSTPGSLQELLVREIGELEYVVGLTVRGSLNEQDIEYLSNKGNFVSLKNLDILKTDILTIPDSMFENWYNLRRIVLPEKLVAIGTCSFCQNNYGSKLQDVIFPNTLKSIGAKAFMGCTSLTQIELPEGLERLEEQCFSYCDNLKSVVIPSTVTLVDRAFYPYSASQVICKAINPPISYGRIANNMVLYVPKSSVKKYESAQYWNNFNKISAIITVEELQELIAQGRELLEKKMFSEIRENLTNNIETYSQSSSLSDIQDITNGYETVSTWINYAQTSTKLYEGFETKINELKQKLDTCEQANPVIVEEATNYYNDVVQAFEAESFDVGDVSDAISIINNYIEKLGLHEQLENKIASLREKLENNEQADTTVVAEATSYLNDIQVRLNEHLSEDEIYEAISVIEGYLVQLNLEDVTINVEVPGTLRQMIDEVVEGDFYRVGRLTVSGSLNDEDVYFIWCGELGEMRYLDMKETNVTSLDVAGEGGLWSLRRVILPKNLMSIGHNCFAWCENLQEIVIPETLQSIGNEAFAWCGSLSQIELPSSLAFIGIGAFQEDYQLRQITCKAMLPPTVEDGNLGDFEYSECTLTVPSMVVQNYMDASPWNEFYNIVGMEITEDELQKLITQANELLEQHMYITIREELSQAVEAYAQHSVENMEKAYQTLYSLIAQAQPSANYYSQIEPKINKLSEKLEKSVYADSSVVAEATDYLSEIQIKFNEESLNNEEINEAIGRIDNFLFELSVVYPTINVETAGTLRTLVDEIVEGDYGWVLGLTVSGSLNDEDVDFIWRKLRSLMRLDMAGTNLTSLKDCDWYLDEETGEEYMGISARDQLLRVVLPKNLISIGHGCFADCGLQEIVFPETLQSIGNEAFARCGSLSQIDLPSSLTFIGNYAFEEDYQLRQITCKAMLPPTVEDGDLGNMNYSECTLIVPAWSVSNYMETEPWNRFNIVGGNFGYGDNLMVISDVQLNTNDSIFEELTPNVSILRSERNEYYGALTVDGATKLSAKNFEMYYDFYMNMMRKDWGDEWTRSSAVLIANAPMSAESVTLQLRMKSNVWNFFSLPFDAKVGNITSDLSVPYVIYKYDGKKRADGDMNNTWVRMTADSTLHAGEGYIWQCGYATDGEGGRREDATFRVTALNTANMNNIFVSDNAEISMKEYASEYAQNRSWNLLGNPYPSYFAARAMDITAPFTVWNLLEQNYEAYSPVDDDYVFMPGEAFFLQRPVDQASIYCVKEGRQTDGGRYDRQFFAGTRQSELKAKRSVFNLTLSGDSQSDRTRFVMNEKAQMGYEMDKDASKFAGMNASAPQLYTIEQGLHYAINERPLQKGEVQVGMTVAQRGTYTLKLDTKVDNEVYLIDRLKGTEILLTEEGYAFEAEAGTTDDRFVVRLGAGEVTGIKSLTPAIAEGEGAIYDLQGRRVNSLSKQGLYLQNGKKVLMRSSKK